MVVDFDETIIGTDDIIANVEKTGYRASLYAKEEIKPKREDKVLTRFVFSLCLLLPLMYFSMGGMLGVPLPDSGVNYAIQFCLTLVILILNRKFFTSGVRAVFSGAANMDTLVALSAGASFLFSIVATIVYFSKGYSGHMFYESAAMVVTLVTLGKWLEDKSKRKTSREIEKLGKLVPKTVTLIKDGKECEVETSNVKVGDILLFRTGDYVAVDGKVADGLAFVDKAAITGESLPVEVGVNGEIVSGSIIKSGFVEAVAEKVGDDTLFSKIIESVRTAGASRAPVQKFADKVAGVFVPTVAAIAVLTFIIWIIATKDIYRSFNFAISVLVISCPCALGLATPVAIMATTGKAAALGILYKDAETIQKSQNIDCVLLDKTATITEGEPKVVKTEFFADENEVKKIASAIESKSTHPLAICIKDYSGESDMKCGSYEYIAGKGAVAEINGRKYYLGNEKLVGDTDGKIAENIREKYSDKGYTTVFLAEGKTLLAVFAISDTIKADSVEAVKALNDNKIKTVMVTGDNRGAAKAIAEQANIGEFVAEVLPDGKADVVKQYKEKGNFVAMVGDGINDSPAIKTADVGIAVGTGTDVAIDSADIVIVGGSLKGILDSILLSKKSNRIIKENLFWAFFYNVLAIPVAGGALAFAGIMLTPSIAAACMCVSSLFVVLNALRITRFKSSFEKASAAVCAAETCGISKIKVEKEGDFSVKTIYVDGMMCMHCVKRVKEVLSKLDGVTNVEVDLESKKVDIYFDKPVGDELIEKAITEADYKIIK